MLRKLIPQKGVLVKVTTPPRFMSRFVQSDIIVALRTGTRTLFHKHLLLTNLAISGGLSAAGDCIEQEYEKLKDKDRKYSVRRTLNMTSAGIVIGGIVHYWYLWLDKFMPGRTFKLAVKKVFNITISSVVNYFNALNPKLFYFSLFRCCLIKL